MTLIGSGIRAVSVPSRLLPKHVQGHILSYTLDGGGFTFSWGASPFLVPAGRKTLSGDLCITAQTISSTLILPYSPLRRCVAHLVRETASFRS